MIKLDSNYDPLSRQALSAWHTGGVKNTFVDCFKQNMENDYYKLELWINELHDKHNVRAAMPMSGWVKLEEQRITFLYYYFLLAPLQAGDIVAIGNPDNYMLVKLKEKIQFIFDVYDNVERWRWQQINT